MAERCPAGHERNSENIRYERGKEVCKPCRQEQYKQLKEENKLMKPAISDVEPIGKDNGLITPLGAAIVEALPNRDEVNRIKRRFRGGICPPSKLFTPEAVVQFYKTRGVSVVAEPQTRQRKQQR